MARGTCLAATLQLRGRNTSRPLGVHRAGVSTSLQAAELRLCPGTLLCSAGLLGHLEALVGRVSFLYCVAQPADPCRPFPGPALPLTL